MAKSSGEMGNVAVLFPSEKERKKDEANICHDPTNIETWTKTLISSLTHALHQSKSTFLLMKTIKNLLKIKMTLH